MGHERVGFLPKTKRWRQIVNSIAATSDFNTKASAVIAAQTMRNVACRFKRMHDDPGVQAAFGYLLALALHNLPLEEKQLASPNSTLEGNPSPARITQRLHEWIWSHASSQEYAELAYRAASDAIAEWSSNCSVQQSLFQSETNSKDIWGKASNGSGFCSVSRSFFAHFTEHYLLYFLEREASSVIESWQEREQFTVSIEEHIDSISKHAFETSKITQSFSAGWFNKYARLMRPTDKQISGFLAIAFNKIYEELQRELS